MIFFEIEMQNFGILLLNKKKILVFFVFFFRVTQPLGSCLLFLVLTSPGQINERFLEFLKDFNHHHHHH